MSLSFLTRQVLKRTNSDTLDRAYVAETYFPEKLPSSRHGHKRSWSGNLAPNHDYQIKGSLDTVAVLKKASRLGHCRLHSTGALPEPKLVRSSEMRREWSFENLTDHRWEMSGN